MRVFPAYAGVSPLSLRVGAVFPCLPRLRGGEPHRLTDAQTCRVFPAYAGVSPRKKLDHSIDGRLPRLRGGEPHGRAWVVRIEESSPPTRG